MHKISVPTPRICLTYIETEEMSRENDDSSPQYSADDEIGDSEEIITPLNTTSILKPQSTQCKPEYQFCYVLWSSVGNGTKVIKQGGE